MGPFADRRGYTLFSLGGVVMEAAPNASLEAALARLVQEGGSDNRLVVSCGPAWFVLRGRRGRSQVSCLAAAKRYLPDSVVLRPENVLFLRRGLSGHG